MAFFRLSNKSDRSSKIHSLKESASRAIRGKLDQNPRSGDVGKVLMNRRSGMETLEKRELLAAEIVATMEASQANTGPLTAASLSSLNVASSSGTVAVDQLHQSGQLHDHNHDLFHDHHHHHGVDIHQHDHPAFQFQIQDPADLEEDISDDYDLKALEEYLINASERARDVGILPHPVFAPDTPQAVVDLWEYYVHLSEDRFLGVEHNHSHGHSHGNSTFSSNQSPDQRDNTGHYHYFPEGQGHNHDHDHGQDYESGHYHFYRFTADGQGHDHGQDYEVGHYHYYPDVQDHGHSQNHNHSQDLGHFHYFADDGAHYVSSTENAGDDPTCNCQGPCQCAAQIVSGSIGMDAAPAQNQDSNQDGSNQDAGDDPTCNCQGPCQCAAQIVSGSIGMDATLIQNQSSNLANYQDAGDDPTCNCQGPCQCAAQFSNASNSSAAIQAQQDNGVATSDQSISVGDDILESLFSPDPSGLGDGSLPLLTGNPPLRWQTSAIGPAAPNIGDPITVTWSIVPDGTPVVDIFNNETVVAQSNLIAFLDGIYGGQNVDIVSEKPWFNIIERGYDSWSAATGVTFVYEPADDGAPAAAAASIGIEGVRGDMRINGRAFPPEANALATNFLPANGGRSGTDGDMNINTGSTFLADVADAPNGPNVALVNLIGHEAGHGLGFSHTLPQDQTKLLEPQLSTAFVGPQEDDLYFAHTLYGDRAEPNDTSATATALGLVQQESIDQIGFSIDNPDDVDLFSFEISSPTVISARVDPTGSQYQIGAEQGPNDPAPPPLELVNRAEEGDLGIRVLDSDGNVLQVINNTSFGSPESLSEVTLSTAGTYFVEVFGSGDTQLYDLSIQVGRPFGFDPRSSDLRLLGVNPSSEDLFSVDDLNVLETAPSELTFRFASDTPIDESTLADGIRFTSAGDDQVRGTEDDVVITPGWIGFGQNDQTVIARFAEPLVDSRYRIEVFGQDIESEGVSALREIDGGLLIPRVDGTDRDIVDFELELGARVLSVVPQPVTRDANGVLSPQRDVVHVFFDDNDLFASFDPANPGTDSLLTPSFYQLIRTEDSIENTDDQRHIPVSVRAVEFETQSVPSQLDSSQTVDVQVRVNRVELTFAQDIAELSGEGAFRLKIGSSSPVTVAGDNSEISLQIEASDIGELASTATTLSLEPGSTVIAAGVIQSAGSPFDFPGANPLEPGHRNILEQTHFLPPAGPDTTPNLTTRYFNFAEDGPFLINNGVEFFTTINEEQKERVREAYALWARHTGIQFIETDTQEIPAGAQINTRVVVGDFASLGSVSEPGGTIGLGGEGLVIMDGAETFFDGFGPSGDGEISFFGVALHEIGHSIGLGHAFELAPSTTMGTNLYFGLEFESETNFPGREDRIHANAIHRPDNYDVDLYRFNVPAGVRGTIDAEAFAQRSFGGSLLDSHLALFRQESDGTVTRIAANNDSFGNDAALRLEIGSGDYLIGVTANGNNGYDPLLPESGGGGDTEGSYQLRVTFRETETSTIRDASGTAFDGDADGIPGGAFNYFFRASSELDTLYVDASAPGGGDGAAATPFAQIDDALNAASPGQTVRIVGNAGADGQIGLAADGFSQAADNFAYEIGRIDSINQTLDDGRDLLVPKDVNVVIDAGAILKLANSRISVGSVPGGIDASGGSLQLLGVPHLPVFITSHNDENLGLENSGLGDSPSPGDFGGIDIRGSIDQAEGRFNAENEGLFLNNIFQTDIRYGGAVVPVNGQLVPIDPIRLDAARPTLIGNRIRDNAGAAVSADPASFEETRFTDLRFQRDSLFIPDYDRVGPIIYGQQMTNNSVNGLLVRVDTAAGSSLEELTVSARFDDTEVVHVLGDNLIIRGNPTGELLQVQATPPTLTTLAPVSTSEGAGLVAGSYSYQLTFVDANGFESLLSDPTSPITVADGQSIRLGNLPVANGDFLSRRLYRTNPDGSVGLVGELDRSDTVFEDSSTQVGVAPLVQNSTAVRSRLDARLQIDPGVIIKSDDVRIELGFGADLIAEGTDVRPVVFTSRSDDRYGAGGTFDTTGNGLTSGAHGDWAGIYARPDASLSIDHAVIAHAGGSSSVEQTTASFNPIDIRQADARIAHTLFESNMGGIAENEDDPGRRTRLENGAAVIYVAGAQPVIVENTFVNTVSTNGESTAAIDINANALLDTTLNDPGRQTGNLDPVSHPNNVGPLIRGNRLEAGVNYTAGVHIRGEILAGAAIFDDTDIVHVVGGSITDSNFHTSGGLQLRSRGDESLVVKFDGTDVGLEATGVPLEIEDRIGGTLQILGQPGFPVVLTSISDNTVGAGLTPDGLPLNTTGGSGTPIPGAFTGVTITSFSNDRNVASIVENESGLGPQGDVNATIGGAEALGQLATDEKSSDENLRLGFVVDGAIEFPGDQDLYSFQGTAGTLVWLDIDRTDQTLDSVIEIIDSSGNVLASSDNSTEEIVNGEIAIPGSAGGLTLFQDPLALRNSNEEATYLDLYTLNPLDAGLRLTLPGSTGSLNEYFVRVSGANQSYGAYELQVRLRELDEFAGSTVRYADIRYAANGISIEGGPTHSPLIGEIRDDGQLDSVNVGTLANTDRGAISIAGVLDGAESERTYQFNVSRIGLQTGTSTAAGANESSTFIAVTLDIDYADGLGRPDTSLLLYRVEDGQRTLIAVASDSNIAADRRDPTEAGSDLDDLSRGSAGTRDAFLGSMELREGNYEVVVTGNAQIPTQLLQSLEPTASNPNIRLEPLGNVIRIAEDRFDGPGGNNDDLPRSTTDTENAFGNTPVQVVLQGEDNAIPFSLGDVTLFVAESGLPSNSARVGSIDAQVGVRDALYTTNQNPLADIVQSPDGFVYASSAGSTGNSTVVNDANAANFFRVNENTQQLDNVGSTGLQTFEAFVNDGGNLVVGRQLRPGIGRVGNGHVFSGLTYQVSGAENQNLAFFGVSSLGNGVDQYVSTVVNPADGNIVGVQSSPATNFLWRLNPTTGAAISAAPNNAQRTGNAIAQGAGTAQIEIGRIQTNLNARVSGLANVQSVLYAVTDQGELISIPDITFNTNHPFASSNPDNNRNLPENTLGTPVTTIIDPDTGVPVVFTSLDAGPRNIVDPTSNLPLSSFLFGTDENGKLFVFNTAGELQPLLQRGLSQQQTEVGSPVGIAFSNLDINLFHRTLARDGDAGHGAPATQDLTRDEDVDGQSSLYFGFEPQDDDNTQVGQWQGQFENNRVTNVPAGEVGRGFDFAGGAHGNIESFGFDLSDYGSDDEPTLYFNYFLETQDLEGNIIGGRTLDSVRVYVASEERQNWALVATNNSQNQGTLFDLAGQDFDEFDRDESRFTQEAASQGTDEAFQPRELFDVADWRQARVPLQPWAGDRDVRIRIEFNSAGESERNVAELRAVDARVLLDGIAGRDPDRSFTITENDLAGNFGGPTTATFEFDFGLVLRAAAGSSIVSGSSFTLSPTNGAAATTFSFVDVTDANPVVFDADGTAADLGVDLVSALIAAGLTVTPDGTDPNLLDVVDAGGNPVNLASDNPQLVQGNQIQLVDGAMLAAVNSLTVTLADPDADAISFALISGTQIPYSVTDAAGRVSANTAIVLQRAGYATVFNALNPSRLQITASDAISITTPDGNSATASSTVASLTDGTIVTPVAGTGLSEGDTLTLTDPVSLTSTTFVLRDNDRLAVDYDGDIDPSTVDDRQTVAANMVAALTEGGLLIQVDPADPTAFRFVDEDGNPSLVGLSATDPGVLQSLLTVSDASQVNEGDSISLTPALGGDAVTFRFADNASSPVPFELAGTAADLAADIVDAVNAEFAGAASIAGVDGTTIVVDDPAVVDFELNNSTGSVLLDVLTFGDGGTIVNGDTFTLVSSQGPLTFTFRTAATATPANTDIVYDPAANANQIAATVATALAAIGATVNASDVSGASRTITDPFGAPLALQAETATVNLGGFEVNPAATPVGGEVLELVSGGTTTNLALRAESDVLITFSTGDDATTLAAAMAAAIDATAQFNAVIDPINDTRVELSDADGTFIEAVASDNDLITNDYRAPGGADLVDASELTVTRPTAEPDPAVTTPIPALPPVTIVLRDSDANSVFFDESDTADEVGVAIGEALADQGFTFSVTASENASTPVNAGSITGGVFVADSPGVDASAVRIPIGVNDTASAIQLAMQTGIATEFTDADGVTNIHQFPLARQSVRLFGFTVNDPGSLGYFQNPTNIFPSGDPDPDNPVTGLFVDFATGLPIATPQPGLDSGVYQEFGESGFPNDAADALRVSGLRASQNNLEGFYLDDFIIGFAERGELVHDATPGTDLSENPLHEQEIVPQGSILDLPDSGEFQLEIRLSADSIRPVGGGPSARAASFDTNDIIGRGLRLGFEFTSGAVIPDGSVFSLSDGNQVAEFEFDHFDNGVGSGVQPGSIPIPFTSDMTPTEIATAFRDAVNSPAASSVLDITAFSPDGSVTQGSGTSTQVLLSGLVASDLNGNLNFAPTLPTLTGAIFGLEIADEGTALGDENRFRDQGQLIIENTFISNSSVYAIASQSLRAGDTEFSLDTSPTQPLPGATQAFGTPNSENLVPGPVIRNNVLFDNGAGGIFIGGDVTNVTLPAASPFVRVINNTIVDNDFGIVVRDGAAPTLLNNAIVGNTTGISADGSVTAIEIFNSLYSDNQIDTDGVGLGGVAQLADNTQVFVDRNGENFYPSIGSQLIDVGNGAQGDRLSLRTLRGSLGIAESPILAPATDITGFTRTDDGDPATGGGVGSSVFIDIGAFDRADRLGPTARLVTPPDNDELGQDQDPLPTVVQLDSGVLDRFVIRIEDIRGAGVSDPSVTVEQLTLTQDGRVLGAGVDYTFAYSATDNTITLTPTSGIWTPGSAYEISINNRERIGLQFVEGDEITDGLEFTVTDDDGVQATFELDGGLAIHFEDVPQDGDIIRFSNGIQVEFDSDGELNGSTTNAIEIAPTDTAESIAIAFTNLVRSTEVGFDTAVPLAGEVVSVTFDPNVDAEITSESIEIISRAGVADGATAVPYLPTSDFSAESTAAAVIAAISASNLSSSAFTPGGGQVFISDAASVTGIGTNNIGAVLDLAGNELSPNRVTRETQFTILLPGTELDFGDAATNLPTLLADNGARHTVTDSAPRFGSFIDTELNSQLVIGENDDAGLTIIGDGTGGLAVSNVDDGIEIVVGDDARPGQTVSINLGNGDVRVFELVLAGNVPVSPTNIPVLIVPSNVGESANALAIRTAERLASVIAENLTQAASGALAPAATVQRESESDRLQVVSVDDEDGVLIFADGPFQGMFIDPEFDSMGGTIDPSLEVLNFLNPNASEGVVLALDVRGNGLVDAWIDFNGDGDFQDTGEQVLLNQPVVDGNTNRVRIVTPANVSLPGGSKDVQARFRISSTGNQRPDGLTIGGEVEDHVVRIVDAPLPQAISATYTINEDNIGNDPLDTAAFPAQYPALTIDTSAFSDVRYVIARTTAFGTVNLDDMGEFTYQPDEDFFGTDTFTYQVIGSIDIGGTVLPVRSELATVAITVNPVNDIPSATNQQLIGVENEDLTFTSDDLLENALPQEDADQRTTPFDEQEQTLSVINIHVLDENGIMVPVLDLTDSNDPFSISEGSVQRETFIEVTTGVFQPFGTLTVNVATDSATGVTEVSDLTFAPEIRVDTGEVDVDGAPILEVVRLDNYNRNSPAPVPFEYVVADNGQTTLPDGTDATDSVTPEIITQTATIALLERNDAPVAGNDVIISIEDPAGGFTIDHATLLANDTAGSVADAEGRNASIDENNGTSDVTLSMPVLIDNPIFNSPDATVSVFTSGLGVIAYNPADPTQFIYTPRPDFYGIDTFVYSITDNGNNVSLDGNGVEINTPSTLTTTATVMLDVRPQNDAPSTPDKPTPAQALTGVFTTTEDPATPLIITANSLTQGSVGHADPQFFSAPQDESNQLFFVSGVFDESDNEITINNVGDPANPNSFNSASGTFRPFFNETAGPSFGHLIRIEYTPGEDFNSAQDLGAGLTSVPDTLAFTLSDDGISIDQRPSVDINGNPFAPYTDEPASVKATVSITVTPVNDAPVLGNDTFDAVEDVALTIPFASISGNDSVGPADEVDGTNDGVLTYSQSPITTTQGGTVTFLANGDLVYNGPAEFSGQDTFVYAATDQGVTENLDGNRVNDALS